MKKLLLIAAMAALALGASADGYKIEKVWERTDVRTLNVTGSRQGFGMDGKFYINDDRFGTTDGEPTIYIYGENGLETTMPGSTNAAITRDQAGNIVVISGIGFSATDWTKGEPAIKVINPNTGETVEYEFPEEAMVIGRCDFLGFPKGNLMNNGELWLTGGTQGNGFSHIAIAGGEVDAGNCYYMVGDGLTASTSTVINYYTDINGDEALLYVTRNAVPLKLAYNEDEYEATNILLPANKSNTNGMFPLIWDGKEFFIYSIRNDANAHYMDGFAIAESDKDPIVTVPCVALGTNGFQSNWLNAEVDANGVTIYQYFPGIDYGHITVWRLTKDVPAPDNVWILGEVNNQSWAPNAGTLMEYDAENGVYVANVTFDGRGQSGENYFSFTTELAENNDDGGWAYIAPYRFGAVAENDFWYDDMYDGQPLGLTYENYQAFRIMNGDYELVLDKVNMTLTIHRWELGDVNHDRTVDVGDVTLLISAILHGVENVEGFYLGQANCDLDEAASIDVGDVTALISRILIGNW